MVKVNLEHVFEKQLTKLTHKQQILHVLKQMLKIVANPEIGKPMRNKRKGTRELYINPFRLAYLYENDEITFLELYHKDEQ